MFALRSPVTRTLAVALVGLFLAAGHAEARAGRGGGFGSRGARTFQTPPPTRTAPTPAQPIQRSTTPQPSPASTRRPRGRAWRSRPGRASSQAAADSSAG